MMYQKHITYWAQRAGIAPTPAVLGTLLDDFFKLVEEEQTENNAHPIASALLRFRGSHAAPLHSLLEYLLLQSLAVSEGRS